MSIINYNIIEKPVITERSTILKDKLNQYVFKVSPSASKYAIAEAIENLFKVEVEKVRTANFSGKLRRLAMGRPQGRRSEWKKAFVTLKKGQSINLEIQQK